MTAISRIVEIVRGWAKHWLGGGSVPVPPLPSVRLGEIPDPLPAGFRFGAYLIESELAPALMGRVYRARDVRSGVTVAVNVLAPSLRDSIGIYRFEKSVIAATTFSDGLCEVGAVDGIPFAVVKYVEGVGPALDVAKVPWGRRTRG